MKKSKLHATTKNSVSNSSKSKLQQYALLKPTSLRHEGKFRTPLAFAMMTTVAAATLLVISNPALAISGGKTTSEPWVVETQSALDANGDITLCSGVAVNAEIILTAAHCPGHLVRYPDGKEIAVSQQVNLDGGDLQMLILPQEHHLSKYPVLGVPAGGSSYQLPIGTRGVVYGYGLFGQRQQRMLGVTVRHRGTGPTVADGYMVSERNGQIQAGDSGGPLLIDGKVVALLSGEATIRDREVYQEYHGLKSAMSKIRQFEHAREMRSTAQVDTDRPWISAVDVQNGKLSIVMSSALINSGRNVFFWVNGNYAGNVQNDVSYYCTKTNFAGGSTISPGIQVKDGDLIQIGIDVGGGAYAPDSSELLYENRFTGLESVKFTGGNIDITMTTSLINSGQRIIVWFNDTYAAEVYNGTNYYSQIDNPSNGSQTFRTSLIPANRDTNVKIGIVPGTVGSDFGTPASANLLYNGTPQ